MAKITAANREQFNEKTGSYRALIAEALKKEKNLTQEGEAPQGGMEKIDLCETMLSAASLSLAINAVSKEMFGINNMDSLNDARKSLYKAVVYLEKTVSYWIDVPFGDYEAKLAAISGISLEARFELVRKLGLGIRMLTDAYGNNSKWRWAFVELNGRYATVAKNILDLKKAGKAYFDPSDPDHEVTVNFLRLVKKLLSQSAGGYRDRYEISTKSIDDIRRAISYLHALRRLCQLMGESDEAEELKKKAQVWEERMERDMRKEQAKQ